MARRVSRSRIAAKPPVATEVEPATRAGRPFWTAGRLALAVAALLVIQWTLAVRSLLGENPTVDEVVHLPAGVTYWQRGTFRLYPHNPPLVKLIAAWPVVAARPETGGIYDGPTSGYWGARNKAAVAHQFAEANAGRYFELFARARLLMPAFALVGGLAVFAWSRQLYGAWGGLLSLTLWTFCPNILAHGRLVTTDLAATSLGFGATYLFWSYLQRPSWARALLAGVVLGLAELTKFSLLLLYGLWPLLWLAREVIAGPREGRAGRVGRAGLHAVEIVAASVLVINAGYGFEGTGQRLGDFPFVCGTLTVPRPRPAIQNPRPTDLYDRIREYRANRFRGTPLAGWPVPLPRYYVLGFDEQKLEADGVWSRFLVRPEDGDRMPPEVADRVVGYWVYLDGVLAQKSWWYYYLFTLLYKVPEGTWAVALLSLGVLVGSRRARAPWADEVALLAVPAVVLGVMSVLTNINLGLRYVLPIFPYVFASAGKVAPWAIGLRGRVRGVMTTVVGACLGATALATAAIHPHYLAYFNWASGGPGNGSAHLIDSNLDWGQDLVGLREWLRTHQPADEPVGLAYFGQVQPNLFALRGDGFAWFLPPALPGTMPVAPPDHRPGGPHARPGPGLYAVSASLVRGLPWRVYAPSRFAPFSAEDRAYSYFQRLNPIDHVGHSIFLYRLDAEDAARLAPLWDRPAGAP